MKYMLIDGNSVGYQYHNGPTLTTNGFQTQAVFGFVKMLRDYKLKYPDFTITVLWDGKARWRYDVHPEYKSNRDPNDPKKAAYKAQIPVMQKFFSALGVRQMLVATHEADDMAGYLVSALLKKPNTEEIALRTGDMDWAQLVQDRVWWFDTREELPKVIKKDNFMDMTGYKNGLAFIQGKCLTGDSSDVVPGVGKIGEKGAPLVLAEFGSVTNFWKKVEKGEFTPKTVGLKNLASVEGKQKFMRNWKLMQLQAVQKPNPEDVTNFPAKFDEEAFVELCAEYGFVSILRNKDEFVRPFK